MYFAGSVWLCGPLQERLALLEQQTSPLVLAIVQIELVKQAGLQTGDRFAAFAHGSNALLQRIDHLHLIA